MGGRSEQKDGILRCISILKNAVSDSTEVNYSIIFDMKQGALSAPVFPLSFLLFQFEPPLKFNFFFLSALLPALRFHRFPLQLDSLL